MAKNSLMTILAGIMASTALVVSGCASSTKDFGDQMGAVSKEWKQAENKTAKGENLVKDGKSDIRKGEDMQQDGLRAERKATRLLAETEAEYELALANVGTATEAEAAEAEAKALRSLEKKIAGLEDDVKDAKSKQTRGVKRVKDGKGKIVKGERLQAEGQAEMKAIEADYKLLTASVS